MVGRKRRQAAESAQVKISACTIAENDGKEATSDEHDGKEATSDEHDGKEATNDEHGQPLREEFAVQLSNQASNQIQEPENNGGESSQPNSANEESSSSNLEEINGLSEFENESDKDITEGLPDSSQPKGDFLVSCNRP